MFKLLCFSLGSTRFLKVARATHSDGTEVVVKVFAKHDPLLQLDSYKTTLMELHRKLYTTANALPFQHFWVSCAGGIYIRGWGYAWRKGEELMNCLIADPVIAYSK